MVNKYKIFVEDDVLVVMRVSEEGVYACYFTTFPDTCVNDVKEMYRLLSDAGLNVEFEDDNH